MSEYGWTRHYTVWAIPFSVGLKLITSIICRTTGHDTLGERMQERKLRMLAELQAQYATS